MNPLLAVSAPGKVILAGEHAVVYGRTAVAASLDLRTYALFGLNVTDGNATDDNATEVRLRLPDLAVDHTWDAATVAAWRSAPSPPAAEGGSKEQAAAALAAEAAALVPADAAAGTARAMQAFLVLYRLLSKAAPNSPLARQSVSVCVRSTLPVGAGLGSSAAFSTCIAAGLLVLAGDVAPPAADGTPWTDAALGRINTAAYWSEVVLHGRASGIDNTLTTFGGARRYSRAEGVCPLGPATTPLVPRAVLLVDTLVEKSTRAQVDKVAQLRSELPRVVERTLDAIEAVADAVAETLAEPLSSAGDARLARLFAVNHALLVALGTSHPALDQAVGLAVGHGLAGAKLTGAGGGGCALVLVSDADLERVDALCNVYTQAGYSPLRATMGGGGVSALAVVSADGAADVVERFVGLSRVELAQWNAQPLSEAVSGVSLEPSPILAHVFDEYAG